MVGIAQRDDRDAAHLGALDRELGRRAGDDLAVTALAVIDDHRPAVADDPAGLVRLDLAAAEIAQIGRDHADPVAVMALQIGLDEVVGDDLRLALGAAGGGEDPPRRGGQLGGIDQQHQSSPRSCCRAAIRSGWAG